MSIEAMAIVLHHSRAGSSAKLVLLGIANHEGDGGSYPAIATLAKYANITERNVQKAIGQLVDLGELSAEIKQGGRVDADPRYRTNRYHVLVTCPPDCDRSKNHHSTIHGGGIDSSEPETAESIDDNSEVSQMTPLNPEVSLATSRGVAGDHPEVSPATPKPSLEPSVKPSARVGAIGAFDAFDEFWHQYPRKVSKPESQKAWKQITKDTDPSTIYAGLHPWLVYWRSRNEPEYVPHPATWLRARRWEDQPPAAPAAQRNGHTRSRSLIDGLKALTYDDAGNLVLP